MSIQTTMAKMMLKKVLSFENSDYLEINLIFEGMKSQIKTSSGKILDTTGHAMLREIFIGKFSKQYPDGKFFTAKIYPDKVEGEVLKHDGSKEIINIQF